MLLRALAPGKTTEIVLHGAKLEGPLRVWTSFPAQVEVAADDSKSSERTQVACKVTLGAGRPVGIGGIVVATPSGVSDVLYVMIDDLPSVAASGVNHAWRRCRKSACPSPSTAYAKGRYPITTVSRPKRASGFRAKSLRRGWAGILIRWSACSMRAATRSCLPTMILRAAPTRDLFSPHRADGQYVHGAARQSL